MKTKRVGCARGLFNVSCVIASLGSDKGKCTGKEITRIVGFINFENGCLFPLVGTGV